MIGNCLKQCNKTALSCYSAVRFVCEKLNFSSILTDTDKINCSFSGIVYDNTYKTSGGHLVELFDSLRFKIVRRGIKIVFPEATDARILGAAARLKAEELVEPILVGNEEEIRNAAHARGIKTSSFTIISPDNYDKWDEMVDTLLNVEMERHPKNKQKRF